MKFLFFFLGALALVSCSRQKASADTAATTLQQEDSLRSKALLFNADSAFSYIEAQLAFGPRVPGTPSHEACGEWLTEKLRSSGAEVITQRATLTAFDGTRLPTKNILGRFNPQAQERILLLAHWDSRPWADADPDPANHSRPVPGANDGASGVATLLEIARNFSRAGIGKGVDILFVDAEDYGSEGDEDSWALGTRYFAQNPPVKDYMPTCAILLDMVGGENARFTREYFSQQSAPALLDELWATAAAAGHSAYFINEPGPAITDDHVELIDAGIPAVDILGFSPRGSFMPTWHTVSDDAAHISLPTLKAVGETLMLWLTKS